MSEQKEKWIAAARKSFRPGMRFCCAICDGYEDLTHAHHVLPLSRQFDIGLSQPDQECVWLCPNHHILVHICISKREIKDSALGCEKSWEKHKGWEKAGILRVANMSFEKERSILSSQAA